MATNSTRLGWIGLGSMGLGMATRLQSYIDTNGFPALSYWNRTISRGHPLKSKGARPCHSVHELVKSSDLVFTSLSDDVALIEIIDQVIEAGNLRNKVIVDTSTVHPDTTSTVAAKLTDVGAVFIAAPVFGASPAAAAGTVLFAVAGSRIEVDTILPYLQAISRKVIRVGDDPKKALLLKTTSNFLMAGIMELVGEAHVLAEKSGLGCDALEELLEANFGPVVFNDSQRMTSGIYAPPKGQQPWSGVELAVKDVTHGIEIAKKYECRLPVGELALQHLETAQKWGKEHERSLDSTSIYGVLREEAGLDFESDVVKAKVERANSKQ